MAMGLRSRGGGAAGNPPAVAVAAAPAADNPAASRGRRRGKAAADAPVENPIEPVEESYELQRALLLSQLAELDEKKRGDRLAGERLPAKSVPTVDISESPKNATHVEASSSTAAFKEVLTQLLPPPDHSKSTVELLLWLQEAWEAGVRSREYLRRLLTKYPAVELLRALHHATSEFDVSAFKSSSDFLAVVIRVLHRDGYMSGSSDLKSLAAKELRMQRTADVTIQEFNTRFRRMVSAAGDRVPTEMAVELYVETCGVDLAVAALIRPSTEWSLDDACRYAINAVQSARPGRAVAAVARVPTETDDGEDGDASVAVVGARPSRGRSAPASRNGAAFDSAVKCMFCNGNNHDRSTCPSLRRRFEGDTIAPATACFLCGGLGHRQGDSHSAPLAAAAASRAAPATSTSASALAPARPAADPPASSADRNAGGGRRRHGRRSGKE